MAIWEIRGQNMGETLEVQQGVWIDAAWRVLCVSVVKKP